MEINTGLSNNRKALALFKWTLRKYLPFSIAYWILLFLSFPLVEIFTMIVCTSEETFKAYVKGMQEAMIGLPSTGFAMVVIAFSTILAIMAFSYLHNKRCVDLFGSFPLSRRALFFSRYFAVIVASAVPMIVLGMIGAILSCSDDAFLEAIKILGILLLEIIGNVSFVAFISVCCGTVADVIISYGVINIAYPICVIICYCFPVSVIPGLSLGYLPDTVFTLFCPVAAPFVAVFGEGSMLHILWWIALSVILMAGCYILSKKRKAETAQNAFAFAAVEIVIKFISCFVAGFGLGWIMAFMGAYDSVTAQYLWFVVGLVMGIMVANILLHLIFHRGLTKYAKSLVECGVVFVSAMVFLIVVATGAFGYDQRVPDVEHIAEIHVQSGDDNKFIVDGKNVLYNGTKDKEEIKIIQKFHKNITKNAQGQKHKGFYAIADRNYDYAYDDFMGSGLEIQYMLNNGRIVTRTYTRTYGDTQVPKEVKSLASDPALKIKSIPAKYLDEMWIVDYGNSVGMDHSFVKGEKEFDADKMNIIIEALKTDIEAQGIYEYEWEEEIPEEVIYRIEVMYSQNHDENMVGTELYIPKSYTNTLKALEDTGYSNLAYYYYKSLDKTFENITSDIYEDSGRTIYFKTPEGWEDDNIRCVLYNEEMEEILVDIDADITECIKVSENLWKYNIPKVDASLFNSAEFSRVVFYQKSGNQFHFTGGIKLSTGKEDNLLVVSDFEESNVNEGVFMEPVCTYKWNSYHEKNKK